MSDVSLITLSLFYAPVYCSGSVVVLFSAAIYKDASLWFMSSMYVDTICLLL